jgi:uncharacterized protein (TIGR02266 family)
MTPVAGTTHLKVVDQRQDARVPLVVRIDAPGAPGFRGATENLAAGGLFIRTDRQLAPGTRVPLLLSFPGLIGAVEIEVEVTWVRAAKAEAPAGVAVRIPPDRPQDRDKLALLAAGVRAPGAEARTYRILLVEDNAQVEAMYEHALRRLRSDVSGVDVSLEYAADGAAALARLARKPRIELVVTDLYMPTMDGFTLVERMRADPALVMTPVLAISAGGEGARDRAVELGVDAYLQKPVKIATILDSVRKLLELGAASK